MLWSRPDTRRNEIAVAIDRLADEAHKFGAFLFGESASSRDKGESAPPPSQRFADNGIEPRPKTQGTLLG
jgi:hypothetical protein